jgi:hypothetical protein
LTTQSSLGAQVLCSRDPEYRREEGASDAQISAAQEYQNID